MNKEVIFSGIQQVGIGVRNVDEAWKWYKEYFGVDVLIFDEWADAEFMLPYTDNKPRPRHANLVLNLQGGGGFEIWQHTGFESREPIFNVRPGDLGIYSCKIKCKDAKSYYAMLKDKGQKVSSEIYTDAADRPFFYLTDPYGNLFQIVQPTEAQAGWMFNENKPTGGVYGAVIGTDKIDETVAFYRDMLGYNVVLGDVTDTFADFAEQGTPGVKFRRVILGHDKSVRKGPFSKLLGPSEIEIIQAIDRDTAPRKIFEGRMWGELGFIQICYDMRYMDNWREICKEKGFPFTVDSMAYKADFDMGEAGGDFAYNEDPAGSLIEYVQTNKVTIMKKFGLALNLKKFNPYKPLPTWMAWCLRFLKK